MKLNKIIIFVMMFVMLALGVFGQEYVDDYTIITGTYVTGDLDSLRTIDGDLFIFNEVTTPLGYDVEFHFFNVTDFKSVFADFQYDGVGTSHIGQLQIYNDDNLMWLTLQEFTLGDELILNFPLEQIERFIDPDGTVKIRFYHSNIGSTNHDLHIDRLVLLPAEEQPDESTCPVDVSGNMLNFFWLICLIIIIVFAIAIKQPLLGVFGGIGLLFLGINLIGCIVTLGMMMIAFSIIIMLYFAFAEL